MHLVGWNKITKPKKLGGHGIWKAREINTAMFGKLVWGFHRDCDSLWVQVLKHKYIGEEMFVNMKKKPGSVTWNTILQALYTLNDGFEFRSGNVNSTF